MNALENKLSYDKNANHETSQEGDFTLSTHGFIFKLMQFNIHTGGSAGNCCYNKGRVWPQQWLFSVLNLWLTLKSTHAFPYTQVKIISPRFSVLYTAEWLPKPAYGRFGWIWPAEGPGSCGLLGKAAAPGT